MSPRVETRTSARALSFEWKTPSREHRNDIFLSPAERRLVINPVNRSGAYGWGMFFGEFLILCTPHARAQVREFRALKLFVPSGERPLLTGRRNRLFLLTASIMQAVYKSYGV
ncbi:unnamed protein product [Lasius platythorax]|uniref:Uncharacterized protein n=1 Tax=Lasius platythorax TaxID=488582 RepID=A0AAV2P460_9HYME